MRVSLLVLLTIVSSTAAFGQKVYDHTGVVTLIQAEPDVSVTTDHGVVSCFGDTNIDCTRHYAGGAFVVKLDDVKLEQSVAPYYGTGGKGNGPKVNPLLPVGNTTRMEFKYRRAFIDINYYNKHVPAFCVPSTDKNGKPGKEACYEIIGF